jgi:hypothetical protein
MNRIVEMYSFEETLKRIQDTKTRPVYSDDLRLCWSGSIGVIASTIAPDNIVSIKES